MSQLKKKDSSVKKNVFVGLFGVRKGFALVRCRSTEKGQEEAE